MPFSLSADSIERQMRLVGDLAFLLHNYELAYNMHHTLKRDLQGRDLWIHYAGAHVRWSTKSATIAKYGIIHIILAHTETAWEHANTYI